MDGLIDFLFVRSLFLGISIAGLRHGPEKKAPTRFERNNKIIKFKIKFKPKSTFSQYTYVK